MPTDPSISFHHVHSIKRTALSMEIIAPGGGKSNPKLIKQDVTPRASTHQLGETLPSGAGFGISPGTRKVNKLSSGIDYGKQWLCDVKAAVISSARNSLFRVLISGITFVLTDSQRKKNGTA